MVSARSVIDKAALRAELLAIVAAALDTATAAHAAAVEGATHAEAQAENDKDTRGLEQSYLARGQAQRVAELEAAVAALGGPPGRAFREGEPVALGALVTVEDGGVLHRYLVERHGGGAMLAGAIQVVTPRSPLGAALLGKHVDDELELQVPGKRRQLLVVAIE